jgi:hypothetical protein
MPVVHIPASQISDWETFHDVFAEALGFPVFYGWLAAAAGVGVGAPAPTADELGYETWHEPALTGQAMSSPSEETTGGAGATVHSAPSHDSWMVAWSKGIEPVTSSTRQEVVETHATASGVP